MEEIPKKFSDPLFTRLFLLAEIGSFTAEEFKQYQQSLENMGDYDNIINTAREEAEKIGWTVGHEQGRAEGRAEGEVAKAREIAGRLLKTGMAKSDAAELVGLTEADLVTAE